MTPVRASSPLTFGPTTSVRSIRDPGATASTARFHAVGGGLLDGVVAGLAFDPDEQRGGIAELLQGDLAEMQAVETAAHRREIGGLRGLHFHENAAGEIDAIVEAGRDEQRHRGDRQQHRDGDAEEARA